MRLVFCSYKICSFSMQPRREAEEESEKEESAADAGREKRKVKESKQDKTKGIYCFFIKDKAPYIVDQILERDD